MRVVGGQFRGRALAAPEHQGVRPTSDRVRESVFNILAHGIDGFTLNGARVLDLFAGTGALGVEALSRGASYALFVDDSAASRALIRTNVENFGLTGVTKIWRRDATDLGPAGHVAPFGLAFLDPPYGQDLAAPALQSLTLGGWLARDAIAVIEDKAGEPMAAPDAFDRLDQRTWGETQVTFLRVRTRN